MPQVGVPRDVAAIREQIKKALDTPYLGTGRRVGDAQYGVYAFYDYDGEPIYVGQTAEKLRRRIRRHLTNHRTDAVAMNVLDPFEVAEMEMWPLFELKADSSKARSVRVLNEAEYTVFRRVLRQSTFRAVLNEKDIPKAKRRSLPKSIRAKIIPEHLYEHRKHADIRIARRASTIAALARVISERDVSKGLRRTLLTQARRLEYLARQRLNDFAGAIPEEHLGEETGEIID